MDKHYICRRMFFQVLRPSLIAALAMALANMADAVVVGNRLGESGLAAIGVVTPLYMIYNVAGFAFSTGGCVTHSRLTADGRDEEALAHFKLMALWVLGLSVVYGILGNLLLEPILALCGADGTHAELHRFCKQYAGPLLLAAPVFVINLLLYDFVRCDNGAFFATLGFSMGCLMDLTLNILFVLALGWGVTGSICATILAQMISVGIMSIHFFRGKGVLTRKRLRAVSPGADSARLVFRSLRIGVSSSARYIFQFLFLMMGNRLLLEAGRRGLIDGEIYVAIFDLVMNVSYLVYGIYQAFSDTMQPLAATFSAEHDWDDLHYLLLLALRRGLAIGILAAVLLGVLNAPVARLFGVTETETLKVSARAVPIFCLSTPFAGVTIILTGFFQSIGKEKLASFATVFRTLIFLLPTTFMAGFFFPFDFWWIFVISEIGSLTVLLAVSRREMRARKDDTPVYSALMDPEHRKLDGVLRGVTAFCEAQNTPLKQAALIELAVEELCLVTQEQAFTGRPDEYIRLTVAKEKEGDYIMHIRNSAPYFNPLDMRMGKMSKDMQEDLLASLGVMLVRRQAKDFHYRNYQGFNVMTLVL